MKKFLLACLAVIVMLPCAIMFTACSGAKLKEGKAYTYSSYTIEYPAGVEEAAKTEITAAIEEEIVEGIAGSTVVCKDGVMTMTYAGGETETLWYTKDGKTIKFYYEEAKAEEDLAYTATIGKKKVTVTMDVSEWFEVEGLKVNLVYKY